MLENYSMAIWGLWLMLLTVLVQSVVAAAAHRAQSHYVPGIVDEKLSHNSFVFRSHRTFHNSLENIVMMFGASLLAMFVGFSSVFLAWLVWVYAVARIVHMVLYYAIATERNPSPRSYFYTIGLLANLVLFVSLAVHMI